MPGLSMYKSWGAVLLLIAGLITGYANAMSNDLATTDAFEWKNDADNAQQALDSGDYVSYTIAIGETAGKLLQLRRYAEADVMLEKAINVLKLYGDAKLLARLYNDLGRSQALQAMPGSAAKYYQLALNQAESAQDWPLLASVQLNLIFNKQVAEFERGRIQVYRQAQSTMQRIDAPHIKGDLLLRLGMAAQEDYRFSSDDNYLKLAAEAFEQSRLTLKDSNSAVTTLYEALGQLGKVYQYQGRFEQAKRALLTALAGSEKYADFEQVYRWYWYLAEVSQLEKKPRDALQYYALAVNMHQQIFVDLDDNNNAIGAQETLYSDYIKLLLQHGGQGGYQSAIDAIEKLRTAELQDYFRDRCVAQSKLTDIDIAGRLVEGDAILYPIQLADRLELLLLTPDRIYHRSSVTDMRQLRRHIYSLRQALEALDQDYQSLSRALYTALLAPLEPWLSKHAVKRLIIVPDYVTAAIPYAALHDGDRFLIERMALSVAPAMQLTNSITADGVGRALYAGISLPLAHYPALPNVPTEIALAARHIPGDQLLNRQFILSQLPQRARSGSYRVLHLASHANLAERVEDSYILAFDGKLTLDMLQQNIGRLRFSETPVDLLTLSACSTASGDNKAALGLAGLAVKSGAGSALASLWAISDEPTARLISHFYKQLADGGVSKSQALQLAQQTLLGDPRLRHPGHWAGFVLVGNWN